MSRWTVASALGALVLIGATTQVVADDPQTEMGQMAPVASVLHKSVDKAIAAAGEVLTYTLVPSYQGDQLLSDVRVSDDIPAGTTYNGNDSPAATTDPAVGASGTVTWKLGSTTAATDAAVPPSPAVDYDYATDFDPGDFELDSTDGPDQYQHQWL